MHPNRITPPPPCFTVTIVHYYKMLHSILFIKIRKRKRHSSYSEVGKGKKKTLFNVYLSGLTILEGFKVVLLGTFYEKEKPASQGSTEKL